MHLNSSTLGASNTEQTENRAPLVVPQMGKIVHMLNSQLLRNKNGTNLKQFEFGSASRIYSAKAVFISSAHFYNNSAAGGIWFKTPQGEKHNSLFQGNTGAFAGAIEHWQWCN